MSCTVNYKNIEYTEEQYDKLLSDAVENLLPNVNMRGTFDTQKLVEIDNLGEVESLHTKSTDNINKKLIEIYNEEGAEAVKDKLISNLNNLKSVNKITIGESRISEYINRLIKPKIADYDTLLKEISKPVDERAADAGVTTDEMQMYDNGGDKRKELPEDVIEKIDSFYKNRLGEGISKLYSAIKTTQRLSYDLLQRSNKFIFADNTTIDARPIVHKADEIADSAIRKINKTFSSNIKALDSFLGLTQKGLTQLSRILSPDNLLMKLGFKQGSVFYNIGYYDVNKGFRNNIDQNTTQDAKVGLLIKNNKKIAGITKLMTINNYNTISKENIIFKEGDIDLSVAEIIGAYLTLRQQGIKEKYVYDAVRIKKAEESGDTLLKITFDKFGKRPERSVTVTEASFAKMEEIATKEEYKDVLSTFKEIFNEQHKKMNATLNTLTGQNLPNIENYYPTYSDAVSNSDVQQSMVDDLRYTKERRNGLKNLRIKDSFDVMHNYIHSTNYYSNMAIPLYNARTFIDMLKESGSIKEEQKQLVAEYEKWLDDMDGNKAQLSYSDADKFINNLYKRYYIGTLGWNAPVVIKQPFSALHAANFFGDMKYGKAMFTAFKEAFTPKSKLIAEMIEHNHTMKTYSESISAPEIGTLLSNGGYGNTSVLINTGFGGKALQLAKNAGNTYIEKSLSLVQKFDLAGRAGLWAASKQFVTDRFGLTESDGDKYWEQVAEMHNQVSEKTQQSFDMIHRSSAGRSNNPIVKGVMMFTTQLQKHLSLLDMAVTNYALYGRKADADNLIRTSMSVLLLQSALIALTDMGVSAILGFDDDDDKQNRFRQLASRTFSNDLATIPFIHLFANNLSNAVFGTNDYTKPIDIPLFQGMQYIQDNINNLGDRDKDLNEKLITLYEGAWQKGSRYAGIPLAPIRQAVQAKENRE